MDKFKTFYESLESRQRRLKEGIPTLIPIKFPTLSKYIPGVIQDDQVIVTAGQGVGGYKM